MATIALYFGSFNPIHNGHVEVADTIANNEIIPIDKVFVIPSPQNPFKDFDSLAHYDHRAEMVNLATNMTKNIFICDIEKDNPPPNYTWDTLECLKKYYPNDTFYIVIGSDNYPRLSEWKNYDKIIAEYRFFVVMRDGDDLSHIESEKFICLPQVTPMSSTEIREKIKKGESVEHLIPRAVDNYIKKEKLYI